MAVQGVAEGTADEQLLVAARAGDPECFARLIEPHIAAGYRLAAAMLSDANQAEDIVQEATLRAWKGMRRLSSSGRLRPWFLSIVANRCRSTRQARWWSVLVVPLPGNIAIRTEAETDQRQDLVQALRRLSPDERAAIFLRFYEDMNSNEVGDVLGISATAARSRIHRALKRLRVELVEEEL